MFMDVVLGSWFKCNNKIDFFIVCCNFVKGKNFNLVNNVYIMVCKLKINIYLMKNVNNFMKF